MDSLGAMRLSVGLVVASALLGSVAWAVPPAIACCSSSTSLIRTEPQVGHDATLIRRAASPAGPASELSSDSSVQHRVPSRSR